MIGKWMKAKLPPARPALVTDTLDSTAGYTGNVHTPTDYNEFMICRFIIIIYYYYYYYYYFIHH